MLGSSEKPDGYDGMFTLNQGFKGYSLRRHLGYQKIRDPVRSPIVKLRSAGLVVGSVTTSESPVVRNHVAVSLNLEHLKNHIVVTQDAAWYDTIIPQRDVPMKTPSSIHLTNRRRRKKKATVTG
jgi:hypothetical protein